MLHLLTQPRYFLTDLTSGCLGAVLYMTELEVFVNSWELRLLTQCLQLVQSLAVSSTSCFCMEVGKGWHVAHWASSFSGEGGGGT